MANTNYKGLIDVTSGLGELLLQHGKCGDWSVMVDEQMAEAANKEMASSKQSKPKPNCIQPIEIQGPPFYAYISSLPFSAKYIDIFYFFGGETKVNEVFLYCNTGGPNRNRFSGSCLLEDFGGRRINIEYVHPLSKSRIRYSMEELENSKLVVCKYPAEPPRLNLEPHANHATRDRIINNNNHSLDSRQNNYKHNFSRPSNFSNDVRNNQNRPPLSQGVRNSHYSQSSTSSWDQQQPSSSTRGSGATHRLPDKEVTLNKEVLPPTKLKPLVKNEDIFGKAKPVDTLLRQREIEEKMEKERKNMENERLESQANQNNDDSSTHYIANSGGGGASSYPHPSQQFYNKNSGGSIRGGGGYAKGGPKSHHTSNASLHSQRGGHRILKPPSYSQQQQISPVPLKELRTTMPPLAKKDSISSLHSTKTAINYNEWNLLEQEQKQNVLPLQQKQQKQNPSEERTSIHLRIKRMEDGNEVSLEGGNNQLSSNRYPSFKKAGGYDSTRRRINDPPRNNSTTMALKKDDLSNTPGESRAVPKLIASQIDVIKNHLPTSVKSESSNKHSVSSNPTTAKKIYTHRTFTRRKEPTSDLRRGGYKGDFAEKKHSTEGPPSTPSNSLKMRSDSMPIVSSSKDEFVEKEPIKKQSFTETPSIQGTTGGETTPKTKSGSAKAKKKAAKRQDTGVSVPTNNKFNALSNMNDI